MHIERTKWHEVDIKPDMKGRHGEPALSREFEQQVEDWIIEQVQNGKFFIWIHLGFCRYGFKREEDAMAFKLRWL